MNILLLALITIIVILGLMFLQYERRKVTSKELSLIAILSCISAISRVPFAAIPGVQPSTFIIICTGYVFGPLPGFVVGATTPLISNLFLGHGPWTIFQMFAWGCVGISASFLKRVRIKGLVFFGIAWGYLFGLIMNMWWWMAYIHPHTLTTLMATMASSIGFDTLHALGNAIFLMVIGERTIKILKRFKNRFHISKN
jgi:energy-coupling factor transport system substrate-specific component